MTTQIKPVFDLHKNTHITPDISGKLPAGLFWRTEKIQFPHIKDGRNVKDTKEELEILKIYEQEGVPYCYGKTEAGETVYGTLDLDKTEFWNQVNRISKEDTRAQLKKRTLAQINECPDDWREGARVHSGYVTFDLFRDWTENDKSQFAAAAKSDLLEKDRPDLLELLDISSDDILQITLQTETEGFTWSEIAELENSAEETLIDQKLDQLTDDDLLDLAGDRDMLGEGCELNGFVNEYGELVSTDALGTLHCFPGYDKFTQHDESYTGLDTTLDTLIESVIKVFESGYSMRSYDFDITELANGMNSLCVTWTATTDLTEECNLTLNLTVAGYYSVELLKFFETLTDNIFDTQNKYL